MKIALSIAGSDSGAGAGIQADLKTFSALGVYGCTAITAITAQNTKQVVEIFEISPSMVEQQIRSIMIDMRPNAIKIGMVYSSPIIDAIYRSLKKKTQEYKIAPYHYYSRYWRQATPQRSIHVICIKIDTFIHSNNSKQDGS